MEDLEEKRFKFCKNEAYLGHNFFVDDSLESESMKLYEGTPIDVTHTKYERNPHARRLCLEHHGYSCKVCDFNFEQSFSKIGKGFIHVHHKEQLADKGGKHMVNPKEDLVPVCPNCHAMIHSERPAYSIEEMWQILSKT